ISDKLVQLNWQRYQEFTTPFNPDNARQALLAFKGDVYSGLGAETFSDTDLTFAQDHVRILSGLYGILKPLDLMQAYRLEMGTKFSTSHRKNLYEFWNSRVTEKLNDDLKVQKNPLLVNLASDEYFKVIHPKILQAPILKISFKENKSGTYKVIAIHAKRARGLMANFVVKNRLINAKDLKSFDSEGYEFNKALSSNEELVFCRD
ncbi:peroxide stress protein YaaA, partial [Thermodesulfobacteriota bacterium]